jgi:hypothetical protein
MKIRRASIAEILTHWSSRVVGCARIASRWRVVVARVMAAAGNDWLPGREFLKFFFSRLAIFLFTGKFSGN